MQVSNAHNPYGAAYAKNVAASRAAQGAPPAASFAECLDKVTVSQEARDKKVSWDYENLPSVAADVKAYHKLLDEGRGPVINTDKWLPENRARLEKIEAEMDKIKASEGYADPSQRSDTTHKKMWDLTSQRAVLETYGESKVVTDKMMAVGASAYREAERDWADANGYQTEQWAQEGPAATAALLTALATGTPRDPEELEKRLEEWKNSQLAGNSGSQTKKEFKAYMDKALGRGKPQPAKSPEEKIKELTAKIKTLQTRLGEVMTDKNLPSAAKSSQAQALTSQINGLHAQIAELSKSVAEDAAEG
ncbi:MAG: FlxA-like family protein [Candidatus Adiutrix sp.]|jgi:polyhydroxyalkanoate synthesis regulator phasin|nr:FlxA-like family protein [Candidatus Adiutrix sp.]